ncbi:uncharacterized protein I303_100917 [Kwoniella dejecticola CBS 10117]|uniref:RanBP2-type domain-containing protein n=1 Tax=Kwoniella dejecticola CBS 10117 TaxID=1296121 RepID=A0A1A6AGB1_9TREE|nr:uncharacterized protein I303_00921 [Kwoniella dejecticola CBS 10117]OBR89099.1 hypothetical protein I303_00921 [Kwoniella dejecticola CBS 10117]
MPEEKGHPKSSSKDLRKKTDHPMNRLDGAGKPRTAEDIQSLIRSLNIRSPREERQSHTSTQVMMGKSTTARASDDITAPDSGSLRHTAGEHTQPPHTSAQHHGNTLSPSSRAPQDAPLTDDKPLPIGTEKKLGLIDKVQQISPSQMYSSYMTPLSPSAAWPHRASYNNQHGNTLPTSTSAPVRQRQASNEVRQDISSHRLSELAYQDRHRIDRQFEVDLFNNPQQHSRSPTLSNAFNPFDDAGRPGDKSIPVTASSTSTTLAQSGQPSSGIEDYNFSDFINTPGFGGFGFTYGASTYQPLHQVSQQAQSSSRAARNVTMPSRDLQAPESSWDTRCDSAVNRRASLPITSWLEQTALAQSPGYRQLTSEAARCARNPNLTHNRVISDDQISSNSHASITGTATLSSVPPHYIVGGSEQYDTSTLPRRVGWSNAQYSNAGLIPANWAPGLEVGPPAPTPFAPGDWYCKQPYCGYHNFQKNLDCRACGHPRPQELFVTHSNVNSPPLGSVGDWKCECGYINWRRRALCKSCYPDHPSNQGKIRSGISVPPSLTYACIERPGANNHQHQHQHRDNNPPPLSTMGASFTTLNKGVNPLYFQPTFGLLDNNVYRVDVDPNDWASPF